MALTLVQFDFPFTGPWGQDMAAALGGLAQDIAAEPGLVWKIWTENPAENRAGGIYVFKSPEGAAAYTAKHTARLARFGIAGIVARSFAINADLSAVTRAPL